MEKQISFTVSDSLLKWIVGLVLSSLLMVSGSFIKWIVYTVDKHDASIVQIGENLDIIQAELSLELKSHGVVYNGPAYKSLASKRAEDK